MGSGISWASRSANVSNEEWDKRWEETFGSGLKKGKKKGSTAKPKSCPAWKAAFYFWNIMSYY